MKRAWLIGAVVLMMAAQAGATAPGIDLVITSINGSPISARKEIAICMSDVVGLDVVYNGRPGYSLFGLGFRIAAVGGPGALDVSGMTYDPEWDLAWEIIDEIVPGLEYEIQESAQDLGIDEDPAGVVVLDHILYHYEGGGADIKIAIEDLDPGQLTYTQEVNWGTGDIQPLSFGEPVWIWEVPEPGAMMLLGLGSLAALRRRRGRV